MATPQPLHSPDPVERGEGLDLESRYRDLGITWGQSRESGTVKADMFLFDEGNLMDNSMSTGELQLSHMKEKTVSLGDAVSYTEPLGNTQCTPNEGEDILIPTLQPPRQYLHGQNSSMAVVDVSKSSSYLLEHNKHLLGSRGNRLGESYTDIASTSVPNPTYCSKCKKMFATSEAYGRHEPMHAFNFKLFPCAECGKYYRHNTALVIHRRTHTGEKPYCCNECGRCFNARSSLVTHGKIHAGEKLYSCSECGKGFSKTDDLFNHQLMHYRERKYTCSDCGKCFKLESELIAHRKNHPVEELFLCSVCGKDFVQYSKLLRHEKTHPRPPPVFITSEKMLKDQDIL